MLKLWFQRLRSEISLPSLKESRVKGFTLVGNLLEIYGTSEIFCEALILTRYFKITLMDDQYGSNDLQTLFLTHSNLKRFFSRGKHS